jgi:hypothetical protein
MCGDGVCDASENHDSCCADCGCANGLVCQDGQCVSPAKCGDGKCNGDETQSTCCQDCGCPTGESCQGGSCARSVECGDGVCNGSETQATCCADCGCPSGESCQSGSCAANPYCGDGVCNGSETQATCCGDCGCPSGESCQSGACQPNAVCGDGVCGAGETQDNCCADCGCLVGYSCRGSCVYVGTSTMTWSITDSCNDGLTIDMRLFDINARLVWPAPPSDYVLAPSQSYSQNITCNTGNKICLGARQGTKYWGVDIDDSKSCTDCCWFCGNITATYNPSCP